MFIKNTISYRQIHECLLTTAKYPFLSVRTIGISVLIMTFDCLSAIGVALQSTQRDENTILLMLSYLLFSVGIIMWAIRTPEMHCKATSFLIVAGVVCSCLATGINSRDFGLNIPDNYHFWIAFREALTTTVYASLAFTIMPYPVWITFGVLMMAQIRTDKSLRNIYLGKMLINAKLLLVLISVSTCAHVLLVITSYFSPLTLLLAPVLTIWLSVFVVFVIYQVISGTTPGALIQVFTPSKR